MHFKKLGLLLCASILFSASASANTQSCERLILPIKFDSYGLPTVDLMLNGSSHPALLDLGSLDAIHLPIADIKKTPNVTYTGNTVKSSNVAGDIFESNEFVVSSLKLGCMVFDDITGLELEPWGASIGQDKINDDTQQSVIGLGFFTGKKISINYQNKMLIVENSMTKKTPSDHKYSELAYKTSKEGISIKVSSDNADYQMILDTGASSSIFSASKVSPKDSLMTCNYDLGPNMKCQLFNSPLKIAGVDFTSNILLYPIDQRFKLDGLLGTDFFKRFVVNIDFLNKTLSILPVDLK